MKAKKDEWYVRVWYKDMTEKQLERIAGIKSSGHGMSLLSNEEDMTFDCRDRAHALRVARRLRTKSKVLSARTYKCSDDE